MFWTRITLTALALTSSLISFVAYTVFLRYLGASAAVDELFYAASVPISVAAILGGVLAYILPPTLARLSRQNQESAVSVLTSICIAVSLVCVLLVLLGTLVSQRAPFWWLLSGFVVTAGLQVIAALQVSLAQARGAYLQTSVSPLVSSVGLFAGALTAILTQRSWLLLVGQLCGAAAAVALLTSTLQVRIRGSVRRDWLVGLAAFGPMKPYGLAIAMGTTAFTLFQPVDALLCNLLGSGSLAIMSYAQRLLVALGTAISLGAHAIAARRSHDTLRIGGRYALRQEAYREASRIIAFGLLVWLAFQLGGNRLLTLLLSSSTMSPDDVARLVEVLGWMLLGVGPMSVMPYFFRVFYTLRDYRKPAVLGISVAPCYGVVGWLLLQRHQVVGLAISYTLVWWAVLLPAVLCLRHLPEQLGRPGLHMGGNIVERSGRA